MSGEEEEPTKETEKEPPVMLEENQESLLSGKPNEGHVSRRKEGLISWVICC